ncbi:MAG TPA: 1-(5-phosphoribosyl)-5-amino-4-imidazole-carboxylate carboxylase, partial [Armatimonadota bacterium]
MDEQHIRKLMDEFRAGTCSDEEFLHQLKLLPFEDLGFAKLDHHRHLRTGFPEVIFSQGKTAEQVAILFQRLADRHPVVMATRVNEEQVAAVQAVVPDSVYYAVPRLLTWHQHGRAWRHDGDPLIAVVAAGTADLPVAEEAAVTA